MDTVLILQHLSADGPGYLGAWLQARGLRSEVRNTEAGDAFPQTLDGYGALVILGGEMSANDPLPSLRQAEALFLQALARDLPTFGHCLGAQLMARALGATVAPLPAPEIGWQPLRALDDAQALACFGHAGPQVVFHWHYEGFTLPRGAHRLAESEACPQQAFSIGPHLATQFHAEIDEHKLRRWALAHDPRAGLDDATHRHVQSSAQMVADLPRHLAAHQQLASRLYSRWLSIG